jgi:hypothetical protein
MSRRRRNPPGPLKTYSVQCEAFSHHPRIERSCPNSRQKDETRILSWFDDKLRLWDVATGQQIGPAMKHDGRNASPWPAHQIGAFCYGVTSELRGRFGEPRIGSVNPRRHQ